VRRSWLSIIGETQVQQRAGERSGSPEERGVRLGPTFWPNSATCSFAPEHRTIQQPRPPMSLLCGRLGDSGQVYALRREGVGAAERLSLFVGRFEQEGALCATFSPGGVQDDLVRRAAPASGPALKRASERVAGGCERAAFPRPLAAPGARFCARGRAAAAGRARPSGCAEHAARAWCNGARSAVRDLLPSPVPPPQLTPSAACRRGAGSCSAWTWLRHWRSTEARAGCAAFVRCLR